MSRLKAQILTALALVAVLAILQIVPAATPTPAPKAAVATVAPPTATITWTAPTLNTDGSAITGALTYNVYQGASATSLTKVASSLSAVTDTISTGLTPGTTQYFAVTAVENGVESAQSGVVKLNVPFPTPGPPTGVACSMVLTSSSPTVITITCQ